MKTLLKYIKVNRGDLVYNLIFQLLAFLVGLVMVIVINTFFNDDSDFAPMGTFFAIIIPVITCIMRCANNRLSLALSMGQTRRSFIVCDTLLNAVSFLVSMAVCRLLLMLELWLYARLYPGFENAFALEMLLTIPKIGVLCAAVAALGLLFAMIKTRFGQKGFSGAWIAMWLLYMVGARAVSAAKEGEAGFLAEAGRDLTNLFNSSSHLGIMGIGLWLSLLLAIIAVLGLRRVELRQ